MKNVILTIVFIAISMLSFGQSKSLEDFNKKSSLIQIEYVDLGSVKNIKVKNVIYTDLISKEVLNGLKFEYEFVSQYRNDLKSVLIDFEEIEILKSSIKIMIENIKLSYTNQTDFKYKSKNRFEIGASYSKGLWNVYIQIKEFDKESYILLSTTDLQNLSNLLDTKIK